MTSRAARPSMRVGGMSHLVINDRDEWLPACLTCLQKPAYRHILHFSFSAPASRCFFCCFSPIGRLAACQQDVLLKLLSIVIVCQPLAASRRCQAHALPEAFAPMD